MVDKKIESIKKNLVILFDEVMVKEGQYSMPYSSRSDDYADWSVTYKIDKVNLHNVTRYKRCQYGGTIYLELIEVKVGFEGNWEYVKYITDLPSWVGDDIKDSMIDEIENWFPNLCVDVDFI